jgi:PAS domain S-box-containing protein
MMKCKTILLVGLLTFGQLMSTASAALPMENQSKPLVIVSKNYMPFFFKEGDGIPRGILVDFWNLWSSKTGVPVQFRAMNLTEAIQQVGDAKADMLAGLSYTSERSPFFYFSRPFYEVSCHLFYRASIEGIQGLKDLSGLRVGVVSTDFFEQFIRRRQPGAVIKAYPSVIRLVEGAIKGEVDAFVLENPVAMTYLAKLDGFKSIKKIASPVTTMHYHAAVKKGNRNLLAKINRGLANISEGEMKTIVRAWTGGIKPFAQTQLPEKVVVASSAGSAPFHFADEQGRPVGLIVDLWRLWSQKTGIEIEFKPVSWGDTLKLVREGKADIHAGLFYNDERETYLDYASALHKSDTHFFFHKSIYGLEKLEDLIGFKIGIIKGDFAVDYIMRELPGATVALYPNNSALFDAVEKGEVRVFIKDTPIALYHMSRRSMLHEFKYHPQRPLYSNMFYAAVKEGNYDLIQIINKGMEAINKEERAVIARKWMGISDTKTADVLVIALSDGYIPLSMRNFEGKPTGMLVDIWRLWAKKTGRKIEFRLSDWSETLTALRNGDADIHSGLFRSKKRHTWMDFSQPFYEVPSIIFYHTQLGILSELEDLSGLKVGAVKGTFQAQYLRENLPEVEVVTFPGAEAMIIAAMGNQAHAFLGEAPISFTLLDRMGGRGLLKQLGQSLFTNKIHASVKKGNTDLLAVVDAGFNDISDQELAEIEKSWIVEPELRQFDRPTFGARLTAAEEAWLAEHKSIRLGVDPAWPPFEFFDATKVYSGIASDYVRLLNGRLDIKMQPVRDLSWAEVVDKARAGEIDVLPCVVKTPERSKFLLFTRPYLSSPMVILTREDAPFITGIEDFESGKVAVIKGYVTQEFLERDYPNREFFLAKDIDEALRAVSKERVDAFVGNLASITYTTQKLRLNNLKVATTTPYKFELAFAVHKDWPELVNILDKSLISLPDAEKTKIHSHWTRVRFEQRVDWELVLWLVGAIVLVGGLILVIIIRWNRALTKEVTERREAEEELRKLSRATEESPATVIVTNHKGTIEYVNPKFTEITGYTAEEAIGQNPRILKAGNQPPELYRELWKTIIAGKEWSGEFCNKKKNGEIFWEHASISPIRNAEGQITHFVAVKEDITERKRMEGELIQAKLTAEEANQAKSDFVANMSHEIRTPMNAIIGMSHLALQTELKPRQEDYLSKIESSANALLGIINDILDFSKIEAGKLDMESVDFNLEEVLDNLASVITVKAQEKKDLEVLFATAQDVPRYLVGDPLRLGQILINLVNNALKFTDTGEIVVSTELVKSEEDQATLRFSVRDTGIGLAQDQKAKLFQAFSQADTSTTRQYGGTGLGLTISRRFVNMMGGKIWVESEHGQGSTFSFTATFSQGREEDEKRLPPSPELRGMKVLVVDDNATSRQILQDILESFSFEVTLTASGQQGLAELENAAVDRPFDLVLMDWKMPEMDGIEASNRIRKHHYLSKTPIIVMVTAYGQEDIIPKADKARLDGFLIKPVSRSSLFDTIMQALGYDVSTQSRAALEKDKEVQGLDNIRGARVLVVEDNEINQQIAQEILVGEGLNVELVSDGQQAVDAVKKTEYDAVLMDVQMPVMDGYEASRAIRSDPHFKDLPIISMTAHAMTGDREKSLDAGMNDHVTKPIEPEKLFAILLRWIQPGINRSEVRQPETDISKKSSTEVSAVLSGPVPTGSGEDHLPESLPGFDLAAGLQRLRGNQRLYKKLLIDFAVNYSKMAGEIRKSLDAKEFEHVHRLVHDLKGLAGNLFATDLLAAAMEMEKLVRKANKNKILPPDTLNLKFATLENALNKALKSVQALGSPAKTKTIAPSVESMVAVPYELAQEVVNRIRDAVEMGDVADLVAFAEELKSRSDAFPPFSEKIIKLAKDFDFESILSLASKLERATEA